MNLTIKRGLVTGREHLLSGINCQDSLATRSFVHDENIYHVGVVADGCGEGTRSETGAHLATSFLALNAQKLVKEGVDIKSIPPRLFPELLGFLDCIMNAYKAEDSPVDKISFIKDHFLFTVLGFVIGPKDTVIYAAGDGVVLLNDLIDVRDQQNTPNYPSYHLVEEKYLKSGHSSIPKEFDIYEADTKDLQRLAIGTDSWGQEILALLHLFNKEEEMNPQRFMNVLSQKEKRFKDDAAIVMAVRDE